MSDDLAGIAGHIMTLGAQLARWARKTPDADAVRFAGTTLTYADLDSRVDRLARALADRGVRTGDRVAILAVNCTEIVESYLACSRMGAIAVPVNFRLVAGEVTYILADSGARALIVHPILADIARTALQTAPDVHDVLLLQDGGAATTDLPAAWVDYESALSAAGGDPVDEDVDENLPAFIMYTSGTTGRPKGAVLTHHNLMVHAVSQILHLGWAKDDRVSGCAVPLFHIAGLAGLLPPLMLGGTQVILPSRGFDPGSILDCIERERISSIFLVPAMLAGIVAEPRLAERDLACLRRITWGAAPATKMLLQQVMDSLPGTELVSGLGQTECSPGTCHLRGVDAIRKIGSVGTPMLNVEVRIVDEEMREVPRGEVGEIVYRGPTVMKEYWNKPEATREAFRGGWFHSGDLVRQDEDGYIYVVDRLKDMIISGGENIYSAEVEEVIAAHPLVADVAVIGVRDEHWGETPAAVIRPVDASRPPSPEDIDAWCLENLAAYKRPRHITVVADLPRSPSGKILKTELRRAFGARNPDPAPASGARCTRPSGW